MRSLASVYADDGRELLGTVELDVKCGQAFCDTCGDCLVCYGEDPCGGTGPPGGHYFVIYEWDLPAWFGLVTVPIEELHKGVCTCPICCPSKPRVVA